MGGCFNIRDKGDIKKQRNMAKLFARLPVQDQKHLNFIQSNPLVLQTKSLWDSDAGGMLLHMMAVTIERDQTNWNFRFMTCFFLLL